MSAPVWDKAWTLTVKSVSGAAVAFENSPVSIPTDDVPDYVQSGHRVEVRATVNEAHTEFEWAKAYAKQGSDDLTVYEQLANLRGAGAISADCHELHFLQMALEKIAKGWLLWKRQGSIDTYRSSHAAVSHFLKSFAKDPIYQARFKRNEPLRTGVEQLAREIEKLAPAVEREVRPANCEYPWSDGRKITVPCDVKFRAGWSSGSHVYVELVAMLRDASANVLQ